MPKATFDTLTWMIRQILKRPSPSCDHNDTQIHTNTKTINTTNGKSTPAVPDEGRSRKTTVLAAKGREVGRKYGLPPNDRTGTNYNTVENLTHTTKNTRE